VLIRLILTSGIRSTHRSMFISRNIVIIQQNKLRKRKCNSFCHLLPRYSLFQARSDDCVGLYRLLLVEAEADGSVVFSFSAGKRYLVCHSESALEAGKSRFKTDSKDDFKVESIGFLDSTSKRSEIPGRASIASYQDNF